MDYTPGQRWISDAEPELGLGTVLRCDTRAVQMLYAKSGVIRNYAAAGAPLSRAAFRVGQKVSGRGVSFVVERIDLREGLLVYSGERRELGEGQLDDEQSLSQADARLISARIERAHHYELRKRVLLARAAARKSPTWGMLSARVALLPHQLGVLAASMEREHPRVLLADEAGLGKTIEAGMLIARMLACGRAARVLIVVPEALVVQWFVEMRRRFQLAFAILDEQRCQAIAADSTHNPFEAEQAVIVARDWLVASKLRAEQCRAAGWDMLVVDEAHHLEWTPEAASPAYALVETLAATTPSVALLSATPEQLGQRGHFARLRLLDPHRYTNLDAFLAEAERYAEWAPIAARLAAGETLRVDERAELATRFAEDPGVLALLDTQPQPPERLLTALVDRHGSGRVMFRNHRDAVGGFPGRMPVLATAPTPLAETARAVLLDEFLADLGLATPGSVGLDYAGDPRSAWLAQLLAAHPGDKFLLIATTRAKVEAIDASLRTLSGVACACFHEGMSLLQRDRAAAWFAQTDGARLLLCSEIGSEGRNFQFAHRLVLWDLPLDPDLLEQRIGRLDRIGQTQTVMLHVPPLPGTAQAALARWHTEGSRTLLACPADGRELLRRFGRALTDAARALASGDAAAVAQLDTVIAATAKTHAELSQNLAEGRDRLLELAARHHGTASLLASMQAADHDRAGHALMQECFEAFGVTVEELGDGSFLLDPEYLSTDALAGFSDGPRRVTFERDVALAREELELLRFDHPLPGGAIDLLLAGEHGNAAFLIDPMLPPRSVLLEAVYVVECVADVALDVQRFLPPTPLTVCVDSRLARRDYTPSAQALAMARERALDVSRYRRHLGQLVPPMLQHAEGLADSDAGAVIDAALAQARQSRAARIDRLHALAAGHAQALTAEIASTQQRGMDILAALGKARPRLDAVRMSVSPDFLSLR